MYFNKSGKPKLALFTQAILMVKWCKYFQKRVKWQPSHERCYMYDISYITESRILYALSKY